MKPKVERLVRQEAERHMRSIVAIVAEYPEYRLELAYVLLGNAVGVCDSFGADVEAFIAGLRSEHEKPPVLVPPKEGAS